MCSTSGFVRKLFNKDPSITAHVPLNAPKDVKLALNSCGFLQLCDILQVPGLVSTDCVVSFSTLLGSRHDAETLAPASQVDCNGRGSARESFWPPLLVASCP